MPSRKNSDDQIHWVVWLLLLSGNPIVWLIVFRLFGDGQ